MVHLIAFELVGIRMPDETQKLELAIREIGEAFAFAKTTWIVESEDDNRQISERLQRYLRPNDRLLVTRVYKDWIGANLRQEEADWLSSRNYAGANDHLSAPVPRR